MQTSTIPVSIRVLLISLFGALATDVFGGSVVVSSAESNVINRMYVINAEVEFVFSDDALGAMRSGVALFIDVDVRIRLRRPYIWDRDVLRISRRYRIERHALTDRYVITDLVTDDRRIYESLAAAVNDLGRIREIPIAEEKDFDKSSDYRISLRARLDLKSLPGPLRPIAYISPSWRMSSGWYQWTLTP